jgi:hypothetical protein
MQGAIFKHNLERKYIYHKFSPIQINLAIVFSLIERTVVIYISIRELKPKADIFPVLKREMLVYTQAYLFLYSKLHRICYTGNKYYSRLIQVITIQCISPTVSRKDTMVRYYGKR